MKSHRRSLPDRDPDVALFAGAWIEIVKIFFYIRMTLVALFAGAWIEMITFISNSSADSSLSSRERGLKYTIPQHLIGFSLSLSSRERGLKSSLPVLNQFPTLSLSSRERGLKYVIVWDCRIIHFVALFAGAWIEIRVMYNTHCLPIVAPFAGAWIERLKFI